MDLPEIVSREEWLAARRELLAREKELTGAYDALAAERRRLPMVEIDKEYLFDGPAGPAGLPDLFEGRRQLIVYHFMFDPAWADGCSRCTPHVNALGDPAQLHERDTTLALVSRAPRPRLAEYGRRMGWALPWYSSAGCDFNRDFHVTLDEDADPLLINFRTRSEHERTVGPWDSWGTELPGVSVFLRDGGRVFHTYSAYARGLDLLVYSRVYLDLTPLGRQGA